MYCIENLVNGKVYVGKHSTEDPDDGYMGSGSLITAAVKKHGRESFRKHTLRECESDQEALLFERMIVDQDFVDDDMTYNLDLGGFGPTRSLGVKQKITATKLLRHPTRKAVQQLKLDEDVVVAEFVSARSIERLLGHNHASISKCCLGQQSTAYDYRWQFKDSPLQSPGPKNLCSSLQLCVRLDLQQCHTTLTPSSRSSLGPWSSGSSV